MRPLRVAIGVVAGTIGGPATYGVQLVGALAALNEPGFRLEVLTDRPGAFAASDTLGVHRVALPSPWAQPFWDNVAIPLALRRLDVDLYHGTKHALPLPGVGRGRAAIVTIHDLAVLAEPETFSRAQRLQLRLHLTHAARAADRILCVSNHAAEDLQQRLGVAPQRISVVPNGVASQFRPPSPEERQAARARLGIGPDEILAAFVGTVQPRKRIEVAIAAVEILRGKGFKIRLAIAGRRRRGYAPAWLGEPPASVLLLGELPDPALVELYGAADLMVSPSTFEGFGLTFAEAMACGCPVVGVAVTSIPEVVGEGGLLVAGSEPGLVAAAMEELAADGSLRADLARRALAQAARLTWDRAARLTLGAYRAGLNR